MSPAKANVKETTQKGIKASGSERAVPVKRWTRSMHTGSL